MRKILIATAFFVSGLSHGQDLRIPNTPAFSILDYEPASVMRPTSAKKLSSDVMSSFDAEGKLIMNLGMEVTPYWLKSRPNLTRKEYLEPGFFQLLIQTLTFSAATVKDTMTGKNNLGVGLRFEIVKGNVSKELAKAEAEELEIETVIDIILNESDNTPASVALAIANINAAMSSRNVSAEKMAEVTRNMSEFASYPLLNTPDKFLNQLSTLYADQSRDKTINIRSLENKRTGFTLELAAASKVVSENETQKIGKAGLWINASYYMSPQDAWTITARQMWRKSDTTSVNTDIGISYIRQEQDFNISLEALARWYNSEIPDINQAGNAILRLEKDFTYRIAAQLSYTVSKDISINLSVGKDFEDAVFKRSGVFSIMGLNYSVFRRRE